MKINYKIITWIVSIFFIVLGIYMSIILKNPHFYTSFAIGMTVLTTVLYRLFSGRSLFDGWSVNKYIIFLFLLIVASILTDRVGMYLGYWYYPHYHTMFDEVVKIIFEFAIAFIYFMNICLLGKILIQKITKMSMLWSFMLSLLIVSPLSLVMTEYINSFSSSWVFLVSKLVWYTIGSWLLALVPFGVYRLTNFLVND